MAKSYPNIGSCSKRAAWAKNPKRAPACMAIGCTCKAAYRVEVEVNCFRGDDEVGNACEAHKRDADALAVGIPAFRDAARAAQARALEKKGQA